MRIWKFKVYSSKLNGFVQSDAEWNSAHRFQDSEVNSKTHLGRFLGGLHYLVQLPDATTENEQDDGQSQGWLTTDFSL